MLRPEALKFLRGADHIIHAGDIGAPEILEALRALAPVTAVRGNNDAGGWARAVPARAKLQIEGISIGVLHELAGLKAGRFDVVVSGHSHKPVVERRDDVLYVNPGSAGRRRFTLPVTAGELKISGRSVRAHIKQLL